MEYVIPPAGLVPAGLWSPPSIDPPIVAKGSLADDINPKTGELFRLVGKKHPVEAQVENRLRLVSGKSPVYERRGVDLSLIRKARAENAEALRLEYEHCLADMVAAKLIKIERIYTGTTLNELGPGTSDMNAGVVVFTNLLTSRTGLRARAPK